MVTTDPIELINTVWADREEIHDALATPAAAGRWEVTEDGLPRLRELRDALRRLAATHTSDPRDRGAAVVDVHAALRTVNQYARRPVLQLTDDGVFAAKVDAGDPDEQRLAAIATEAVKLFGQGDGFDLRACLGPGCVRYFVKDHPRQEWCSAGCGNRARAARHYARHGRTTR